MTRISLAAATQWITALAQDPSPGLAKRVALRAGCSVSAARQLIRQLTDCGWLQRSGPICRPLYQPGLMRQIVQRYPLVGLDEDRPWAKDFAPYFNLTPTVREMMQHAFTELLNNAIDHSEGTQVTLSMRQTASHVQLLVSDDGRGLFDKIREGFAIDDPGAAMLELSKGRLTSSPARHTGRGLFFTSRLADVFDLHANAVAFQHRDWDPSHWVRGKAMRQAGSAIYMAIALDTERTLDEVLRSASLDGASYGIERTRLPLRLMTSEHVSLESRAQARRVASRLGNFREAELDFSGVERIGQGFADELFRVFGRDQTSMQLVVRNASQKVAAMIATVQAG
ncbi:STAS-like domain-containing protein [Ideonella sp.]|uniref:STAS-like domain-containing protein n=1 Tax=Ideonella sp. TaxID=1929293 RepID=UPI003BB5A0B7